MLENYQDRKQSCCGKNFPKITHFLKILLMFSLQKCSSLREMEFESQLDWNENSKSLLFLGAFETFEEKQI